VDPVRVIRIFKLIDYLTDHSDGRLLSEVARDLDVPLSSTHDLLQTMVEARVLVGEGKRYLLGPLAFSLGVRLAEASDVRRVARPHLRELAADIEDDVYMAVSTGGLVMYVDHYPGTRRVRVTIRLGQRLYLHSTATGKLFAAFDPKLRQAALEGPLPKLTAYTITSAKKLAKELDEIAEAGFSVTRQESFEGIVGISVPIWMPDGQMPAAIHVSVLLSQALDSRLPGVIAKLKETAKLIGNEVGPVTAPADASGRDRRSA
jgi:DNA-binding IclR family transcriptional regulator